MSVVCVSSALTLLLRLDSAVFCSLFTYYIAVGNVVVLQKLQHYLLQCLFDILIRLPVDLVNHTTYTRWCIF